MDRLLVIYGLLILGWYIIWRYAPRKKNKKRNSSKKNDRTGKDMVYILANPSYRPGIFKIGLTTRDISVRMRELFTTGVPTPFVKCMALETRDCRVLEKILHTKYLDNRVNKRREFFKLDLDELRDIANSSTSGHYTVVYNDLEASAKALEGTLTVS